MAESKSKEEELVDMHLSKLRRHVGLSGRKHQKKGDESIVLDLLNGHIKILEKYSIVLRNIRRNAYKDPFEAIKHIIRINQDSGDQMDSYAVASEREVDNLISRVKELERFNNIPASSSKQQQQRQAASMAEAIIRGQQAAASSNNSSKQRHHEQQAAAIAASAPPTPPPVQGRDAVLPRVNEPKLHDRTQSVRASSFPAPASSHHSSSSTTKKVKFGSRFKKNDYNPKLPTITEVKDDSSSPVKSKPAKKLGKTLKLTTGPPMLLTKPTSKSKTCKRNPAKQSCKERDDEGPMDEECELSAKDRCVYKKSTKKTSSKGGGKKTTKKKNRPSKSRCNKN